MCIETVNIAFQACLFISLNFSKELMLKWPEKAGMKYYTENSLGNMDQTDTDRFYLLDMTLKSDLYVKLIFFASQICNIVSWNVKQEVACTL